MPKLPTTMPPEVQTVHCPLCFTREAMNLRVDKRGSFYYRCGTCARFLHALDAEAVFRVQSLALLLERAGIDEMRAEAARLHAAALGRGTAPSTPTLTAQEVRP